MVSTASSLSKSGEGWTRVCPGLLVAPVGSSYDVWVREIWAEAQDQQGSRQRTLLPLPATASA